MRNKQIVLAIFSMLLLLCSCAAQPNIAPQTQERETPQEKGPEMPESASTAANELFQMLLDAACPAGSAVRFGAWLDAHPDYADTVQDASCEYAAMENGTERVRFLKTNCDRFSRYAADASQTVVYQLWPVDGEVREGVSGALEPAPAEWEPAEWEKLAGFFVAEPLWTIDLASLDGFYALAPADANGTASGCAAPDSGLSVYSDGSVTLCFTEEAPGGPEILLHIHVQSGDAAYLGVRLGDRVDALVEALETQKRRPGRALDHRPRRLRCGWPRQVHPLPGNGRTYHGAVPVCLQITAVPNSMHRFNLRMDGSRGWYIRRRRHREHILSARSPCRSRPGRSL